MAVPLLDLYGTTPEVFVANRVAGLPILWFALGVAFGPPLVGLALLALASLVGPRTSHAVTLVLVAIGGVGTGLVITRQAIPNNTVVAIAATAAIAAVVVWLAHHVENLLALFSVALPGALVLFVAVSPSSRLIWGSTEAPLHTDGGVGNPQSVVFIQLDELPTATLMTPDGTINEALFPNFGRLAREGTWYRNAMSVSIATTQSVPSIMTGRLVEKGLSPSVIDHPDNLFTLLDGSYDMHVIEGVAALCPDEVCGDFAGRTPARFASLLGDVGVVYGHLALPAAGRNALPSIDNAWRGFLGQGDAGPGAADVDGFDVPPAGVRSDWIDWLQRIIDGIGRDEPPTLHYTHLPSPHVPWRINPSGTHYERPEQYTEVDGVAGSGFWVDDQNLGRLGFQRHLYQTGFLDQMLGALIGRLEGAGMWEDAMVIVVSDHGASFTAGEHRRWPYENNRNDLYRVPLFIKYPGQTEGGIVDEPAYGIDIVPTIVGALEIETDWSFDGIDLRTVAGTNRPHEIVHWCCSTEGADTDLASLFAQVDWNHRLVPNQSSWEAVAAVGPHASLVGPSAPDAVIDTDLRWSFEYPVGYGDRGITQTLVSGRVELPADVESDDVLVVVNGRVAGTGFLVRDTPTGGQLRGLIAEEYLDEGTNEVTLMVWDGARWLTGSEGDVDLEFVTADGRTLELEPEGNRRLQVDEVQATDDGFVVSGWSADVSAKLTPDQIYVFAGATLVDFGPPNVDNPNVVGWFDSDNLLRSGFRFEVDGSLVPAGTEQLTVIAEFGTSAIADPASLPQG